MGNIIMRCGWILLGSCCVRIALPMLHHVMQIVHKTEHKAKQQVDRVHKRCHNIEPSVPERIFFIFRSLCKLQSLRAEDESCKHQK